MFSSPTLSLRHLGKNKDAFKFENWFYTFLFAATYDYKSGSNFLQTSALTIKFKEKEIRMAAGLRTAKGSTTYLFNDIIAVTKPACGGGVGRKANSLQLINCREQQKNNTRIRKVLYILVSSQHGELATPPPALSQTEKKRKKV